MPRSTKAPELDTADPYMSVNDIAKYLGVARANVYRMMASGQLPYVTIGTRRRVRQSDVKRLVEAGS